MQAMISAKALLQENHTTSGAEMKTLEEWTQEDDIGITQYEVYAMTKATRTSQICIFN